MAASIAMIVMTIISSRSVKPRAHTYHSLYFVPSSAFPFGFCVNVEDVLAAP